jgi:type VI protein secretion system component VasK
MSTALLSGTITSLVAWATDPVPDPADVKPGWIALVTVVLLGLACLALWFSMRRQIKRIQVPREDEDSPAEPVTTPDDQR